jgi:hypothetical protein
MRLLRHLPLLVLLLATAAPAQDTPYVPKPVPNPAPAAALPFWETSAGMHLNTVANLVLARHPYTIAVERLAAAENPLLAEWQFNTDLAMPLPERLLRIKDGTPMPDFTGKKPPTPDDWLFYELHNRALVLASDTPEENFKKSAEDYKYVQFSHLFGDPDRYRGKVVPVQGRLLVLRQYPAPQIAANQGVKFVYEAWVKGPTRHTNPFCLQFTELPEGLALTESGEREVTFYGYFLKKFEYQAANAKRLTLLLVGHSIELPGPAPATHEPEQPFSRLVVFTVAGVAVVLTALVVGFSWWFRRGDVNVHSTLSKLREKHGLDFEDEVQPTPPLATPVPAPAVEPKHQNGTAGEPERNGGQAEPHAGGTT